MCLPSAKLDAAQPEPAASATDEAELRRLVDQRRGLEERIAGKNAELRRLAIDLRAFRVHMGALQTAACQPGGGR